MIKRIALGGDHAGYELKKTVVTYLTSLGITVEDKGPHTPDSVDYPDFVHPVCDLVLQKEVDLGILICGSGNGVAITANKYDGIRCGLCWTPELASLTRQHNNANILAIPARFIEEETAIATIKSFLTSMFEGGRHERRVNKIVPLRSC
ncbi:MAG: ribose 5-phosphate isomerase B [Saprospiraceae bacterium]|jgi:ribose 5-phosphate isomerase B